ncbi:MAG: hypothetical protein U7123_08955 [Potamolinea sp.]
MPPVVSGVAFAPKYLAITDNLTTQMLRPSCQWSGRSRCGSNGMSELQERCYICR